MSKIYKYDGEEFTISAPKDCRIAVSARGITGYVTILSNTNQFREEVNGWGTQQDDLSNALDACCRRIINASKRPSREEQCKNIGEFYDGLA